MTDAQKDKPQQQMQGFNKIILNIQKIIGLIFIVISPIQLILLLLAQN